MSELLPCPFCGGEPERVELTDRENFGGSVICCKSCMVSSPVHFDRKENLDDSWNRRAPSPSPAPGVVEAAKAVLANWDERLADGPEAYKTSADLDFSYWSPSASMVASEHMAALRFALASLSQPAKGAEGGE